VPVTTAYFHEPHALAAELDDAGLRLEAILPVEGPRGCSSTDVPREESARPEAFQWATVVVTLEKLDEAVDQVAQEKRSGKQS
jgi:hypothetical protein